MNIQSIEKQNSALNTKLKAVFANTFVLYLKTLNYHWHVTGGAFYSLHKLFEDQYTALSTHVDDAAERIVQLGDRVPATMSTISKCAQLAENENLTNANDMIKDLASAHREVVSLCQSAIQVASEAQDEATIGLLTEQLSFHEKQIWMLTSSLSK